MNKTAASLINKLSKITGKSKKLMKREYYSLSDGDRFLFKKKAKALINQPEAKE